MVLHYEKESLKQIKDVSVHIHRVSACAQNSYLFRAVNNDYHLTWGRAYFHAQIQISWLHLVMLSHAKLLDKFK